MSLSAERIKMAWIEAHQTLKDHPKVIDLMNLMEWDLDTTIGKLFRFWWWCVDYAQDGDLTKHNDSRLAVAVGLNGSQGKQFVESMVQSGWIDREPYFRVHDWWEYIGRFLQTKYKQNPKAWKEIQERCLNGSKNIQPNLTQPDLTQPNLTKPKESDKKPSEFSEAFVQKAEMAKGLGINIYQLIGYYKKRTKVCEEIPEAVLDRVLDRVVKYAPKGDKFPYFLETLNQESMRYFSQSNVSKGFEYKNAPSSLADILKAATV